MLEEKEKIISTLRAEFLENEKLLLAQIKDKDKIIINLKKELDLSICERNESINKLQSILKELGNGFHGDTKNKLPMGINKKPVVLILNLF